MQERKSKELMSNIPEDLRKFFKTGNQSEGRKEEINFVRITNTSNRIILLFRRLNSFGNKNCWHQKKCVKTQTQQQDPTFILTYAICTYQIPPKKSGHDVKRQLLSFFSPFFLCDEFLTPISNPLY